MQLQRRHFLDRSLRAGLALSLTANSFTAFAQQGEAGPDLSFVAPELRPFARSLAKGIPDFSTETLPQMRANQAHTPPIALPADLAAITITERQIPVPEAPAVTVYVVNSDPERSRPAILHIHGGGFVVGSARTYLPGLRKIAAALDCVVVTVDYRLAPETRYTGSIEDNYASLEWLYERADCLGVDRTRIAVMGESAGGGHAALLAIAARDRGKVPLCFQLLLYPMLDDRTGSTRMPRKNVGTLAWTPASNRFGWESFLGCPPGGPDVPAAAVPARMQNLAGLPPAFIGVGGIDLFVDEDIEYARRLVSAGVTTDLLVVPGAYHGFDIFAPETMLAKRFSAAKMDALRRAFLVEG